jgi:signal transduction histidine kinase
VGDPTLLERVAANLLDNAVKYSPGHGTVRVEVRRDDGSAALTVRDQGPGVPAEQVPHLFTRFFRGDPARPRAEGSGLGLAIARAGAEAHGGALDYAGDAGGAAFRLVLPAGGAHAAGRSR